MATERVKKPAKRRKKRTPKRAAAELAIEGRRAQVTKLRLSGWPLRDIAKHLGVSVGTAHSDVTAVLERTKEEADGYVDREREISLSRLEKAVKGIWPSIETGDLEAIDRLVKLEARRAKTIGFDAPTKLHAEVNAVELDEIDALRAAAKANECSPKGQPNPPETNE